MTTDPLEASLPAASSIMAAKVSSASLLRRCSKDSATMTDNDSGEEGDEHTTTIMTIPHNIPLHEQQPLQNDDCDNANTMNQYDAARIMIDEQQLRRTKTRRTRSRQRATRSCSHYYSSPSSPSLHSLFVMTLLLLLFCSSIFSMAASSLAMDSSSIHDKSSNLHEDEDSYNRHDDDTNNNVVADSSSTTTSSSSSSSFPVTNINKISFMASSSSPHNKKPTTQQIIEANSICQQLMSAAKKSSSFFNTHLRNKPLLSSGCRKYISCDTSSSANAGSVLQFHTCPDDLLFDVTIQICNWEDRVDCPEYHAPEEIEEEEGDEEEEIDNLPVGVEEEEDGTLDVNDLFDIGSINQQEEDDEEEEQSTTTTSTTTTTTSATTSTATNNIKINPYNEALLTVCTDKSTGLYPLPTTMCKEYVSCVSGEVSQTQSCADRLVFDSTIQGCNWESLVECDDPSPPPSTGTGNNEGGGEGEEEEEGETSTTTASPTMTPTVKQLQGPPPQALLSKVCADKYSGIHSVPTTMCKYYVSCVDGQVFQTQSCPDRLVFDSNIMGCNWENLVECNDDAGLPPSPASTGTGNGEEGGETSTLDDPTAFPTRAKQQGQPQPAPPSPSNTNDNDGKAKFKVYEWLEGRKEQLNDEVFQSITKDGVNYRSYWFQYNDFIRALKIMNGNRRGTITGDPKHSFFLGNMRNEWEYGVVNVAAFLAHAMTVSIKHDACDEFHEDMNTDVGAVKTPSDEFYAISNSCGQYGFNYADYHCEEDERHMECGVDKNMNLQATTSLIYPTAPPPLSCRPRSVSESYTGYWDGGIGKEMSVFPYENAFGRTDTEGCCYWGRGAIHTRGICNLGKLNYYLGKKAADDGRKSRYPTTDFCAFPEAICAAPESKEMRWLTSMFEWTERVQSFDDRKGFNYLDELRKFVDGGLIDLDFFHATSGILDGGCLEPPCTGSTTGKMGSKEVYLREERLENFQTILRALNTGSEKALLRGIIKYFTDLSDVLNGQVLRSQTPQGQLYPSYRYTLDDMLASITFMAETGAGGRKFYIGEANKIDGVKYGIVNVVTFLSQAYKEAIQFDACDENNWQLVNDRFPLSNSCGQLGMSYQDMHCREDEAYMECPVKTEMEQYALTSALWFQAPGPFKCGPRSKFPTSGFWDYDLGRENNEDAYANSRGRVDVEGCCWWGRGVIQTRGVCNFGKLNYYLGKRAHREGRPALYPDIDFCEFPQGVCSSDQTYGGQMQWTVGLFEWSDRIQTYSKSGWNYMDELKKFVDGGYTDFSFVDAVSGVVNIGCHDPPCQGFGDRAVEPHNKRDRNDTFQRFLNQLQVNRNFRAEPPPTPLPTLQPTLPGTDVQLTLSPTEPRAPTESPTFTPAPSANQGRPPESSVDAVEEVITNSKGRLTELVLRSEHPSGELWPSYLYTWRGFLKAMRKMTTGVGPGEKNFLYVGDGESPNSLDYGLVNIAAFLADGVVKTIHDDTCDEHSYEMVNGRYPISNSCGQGGLSYQDDKCTDGDEGMECAVDTNMVVEGVTHARWLGAPPPMHCGDRSTGYWDHVAGLERQEPPFENAAGRSDVRGCCWWGRGVAQVRGVCSYGKLNYYLGAKAAADGRPSIYPDINFCTNPGIICSGKHSDELRWVTGMFHWSTNVQKIRSRDYSYMDSLQNYVDEGNFTATVFIDGVNDVLGGNNNDTDKLRSETFFDALRAFGLIEDYTSDYCGKNVTDAGTKCVKCVSDFDCPGNELCQPGVIACNGYEGGGSVEGEDDSSFGADVIVVEIDLSDNVTSTGKILPNAGVVGDESDSEISSFATFVMPTSSFCGENWGHASLSCLIACPGGNDAECPPNQKCFADVAACSQTPDDKLQLDMMNYCGRTWDDASMMCFARTQCPGGQDAECPVGEKCFAGIHC